MELPVPENPSFVYPTYHYYVYGQLKSKSSDRQILINLLDKEEVDLDCFVCMQTLTTNIMVVNLPVSKTLLIYTTSIEKESNL